MARFKKRISTKEIEIKTDADVFKESIKTEKENLIPSIEETVSQSEPKHSRSPGKVSKAKALLAQVS